jgi:hypothetical protein
MASRMEQYETVTIGTGEVSFGLGWRASELELLPVLD